MYDFWGAGPVLVLYPYTWYNAPTTPNPVIMMSWDQLREQLLSDEDESRMMLSTTMLQSEITAAVDADALPALVESDSDDDPEPSNNSSSMCTKVWHLMKCIRCCWPSWPPTRSGSSSLFFDSSAADTPTVGHFLIGAPFTIASIYQHAQANSGAATDAFG